MDKYKCDTCAYRFVKIYAEPCTNCMDGSKYEAADVSGGVNESEPIEGSDD